MFNQKSEYYNRLMSNNLFDHAMLPCTNA